MTPQEQAKATQDAQTAMEKDRLEQEARMKSTSDTLGRYTNDPGGSFNLHGNEDQVANQAANLSQVGAMTGQNLFDIGRESSQYNNLLQDRLSNGNPTATHMLNERNRNMANTARSIAGRGVAGGVAAAGMNTAQNTADSGINDQMYKNDRTNQQDLFNWVKRNQKVTGDALSMGADQGLADKIDTSTGSGIFGSVICTELHRQGLLDNKTYILDSAYGWALSIQDPYAYIGYHAWAKHVVPLMKRSKKVTRMAAFFALPWAKQLAGEKSIRGTLVMAIGLPVCRVIGKLKVHNPFRTLSHA